MTRCDWNWLAGIIVYATMAFIVFGHEAARFDREWPASADSTVAPNAMLAAAIWPVYIPARLSWEAWS